MTNACTSGVSAALTIPRKWLPDEKLPLGKGVFLRDLLEEHRFDAVYHWGIFDKTKFFDRWREKA